MNINREPILATVRRALGETPAVALLGPRQVGKTTLAREIARSTDGAEFDLVFECGGKPFIGIEIKRSAAPKITPGFSIACDYLSIEHRFVVSSGSDSYRTNGGAEVLPVLTAIAKVQDLLKSPFA